MSSHDDHAASEQTRKPFRAVDVLSGAIDNVDHHGRNGDSGGTARNGVTAPERTRKQISAQLEPAQVRLLGELHARLNAEARSRIEKSDLVGLGIELLAAVLAVDSAGRNLAPEPDGTRRQTGNGKGETDDVPPDFRGAAELRAYVRTWVRRYGS